MRRLAIPIFAMAWCCAAAAAEDPSAALREAAAELRKAAAELREAAAELKAAAGRPTVSEKIRVGRLEIEVRPGFIGVPTHSVMKVLQSAADVQLRHVPAEQQFKPLAVAYHTQGPVLWYENSRVDMHSTCVLRLSATHAYWSQYIFQFSHELCHVLQNSHLQDVQTPGPLWFEEVLCHTASLDTLRALAESWKTNPPFPGEGWTGYAPRLREYADEIITPRRLPADKSPAQWYAENKEHLLNRDYPEQRSLFNTAAVFLLPLFEERPEAWESLAWRNLRRPELSSQTLTFEQVLGEWRVHSPERHWPLIEKIAATFGVSVAQ